jgi:hypothetical protein
MRESGRILLGIGLAAACSASLLAAAHLPAGAQNADAVLVHDAAASAPLVVASTGLVELNIDIVPTSESRQLRVVADSGTHRRGQTIDLDGEASERQHTVLWSGLPVGRYEVLGTIVDAAGDDQVVVRGYLRVID